MTDVLGVPVQQTGNGYTYDNYAGEESAPFFLGTWIGKITGNPGGFISNYREWHILLAGCVAGVKAATLSNVPDCPPLWLDEQQYFDTPAMVVNVVKCQWPTVSLAIAGLATKTVGLW